MSNNRHDGWPVEALRKLAKIKQLHEIVHEANSTKLEENPEIKSIDDQLAVLQEQRDALLERRTELINNTSVDSRTNLGHIFQQIEDLNREAKELKASVPEVVNEFIEAICNGVSWSAPFQVVWWNKRFVILRLPGRKFWSARNQAYAQSTTKMYDLEKFKKYPRRGDGFASTGLERQCAVRTVEGRLRAATLKEWKDEAEYAIA